MPYKMQLEKREMTLLPNNGYPESVNIGKVSTGGARHRNAPGPTQAGSPTHCIKMHEVPRPSSAWAGLLILLNDDVAG
jgi:hypothetical protein